MPVFSDGAEGTPIGSAEGVTAVPPAKISLRGEVLARRRRRPAEARTRAGRHLQRALSDLVRRRRPRCVTGYVPVGTEPGGAELPEALRASLGSAGRLLLPVLRPDLDLDWAVYTGSDALITAGRGVREPVGERLGVSAIGAADLVVVPALAVDRRGIRLGRGGGSYDRALARVSAGALVVALLYDDELVERVPAEPHDRPVHAVITPRMGLREIPAR